VAAPPALQLEGMKLGKVMVTLVSPGGAPSVEEIETAFGLAPSDIDRQFGVVEVDDLTHQYTILVEESAGPRIHSTERWRVVGSFSNPRIAPFGPQGSDQ
jgi:hypothetical protein